MYVLINWAVEHRVADWFAQLNNKMGGDLKKIRTVGEYMIEVWKAVGMDLSKVEFLWASDEINAQPKQYWELVMDVAMKNNLKRIVRCSQIMGRGDQEDLSAAQIFYPCMQCADIFFLKVRFSRSPPPSLALNPSQFLSGTLPGTLAEVPLVLCLAELLKNCGSASCMACFLCLG